MFEPPVAASFTTAIRSNGLPATGFGGAVGTSVPGGPLWLSPDTTDNESGPTAWPVSTGAIHEASTRSPAIRASEERRMTPPRGRGLVETAPRGGDPQGYVPFLRSAVAVAF